MELLVVDTGHMHYRTDVELFDPVTLVLKTQHRSDLLLFCEDPLVGELLLQQFFIVLWVVFPVVKNWSDVRQSNTF